MMAAIPYYRTLALAAVILLTTTLEAADRFELPMLMRGA